MQETAGRQAVLGEASAPGRCCLALCGRNGSPRPPGAHAHQALLDHILVLLPRPRHAQERHTHTETSRPNDIHTHRHHVTPTRLASPRSLRSKPRSATCDIRDSAQSPAVASAHALSLIRRPQPRPFHPPPPCPRASPPSRIRSRHSSDCSLFASAHDFVSICCESAALRGLRQSQ